MKPERLGSLDLARGLAIVFMVMVHVLEMYASMDVSDSTFGSVVLFLGGPPAAPVFMFLMGVSLSFSTRATLSQGVRRGFILLGLAYLLNLLRGTLPLMLILESGDVSPTEIQPFTPTAMFWLVDILQFAGLSLILLAFIRRFLPYPIAWLLLAIAVALISPLLWGWTSGWIALDRLLELLWGANGELVAFPLFPWLSYPLIGLLFGHWLVQRNDHDRIFSRALWAGLALMLVSTPLLLIDPKFHIGDYYRSGPGGVCWISGFVLSWTSICHWITKKVRTNFVFRVLTDWSRNVTVFYFIHWVIIGWGLIIMGHKTLNILLTVCIMIVITGLAAMGTRLWLLVLRSWRQSSA